MVDAAFFEDGKGFDGSSIAGWKGIQESDMILMPDPSTAIPDPFFDEPTLNLRCDVVEPSTMQGYDRCPRSLAKRAEAYLKSTGIAGRRRCGDPRTSSSCSTTCATALHATAAITKSIRTRAPGTRRDDRRRQPGSSSGIKGGYFPVPPVDAYQDLRTAMCGAMEDLGLHVEVHHSRWRRAARPEINVSANTLVEKGRRSADPQVRDPQRCGDVLASRRPSCRSRSSATTATACT
jgi:glutamine synthetase